MKRFNPNTPCAKCGNHAKHVEWHEADDRVISKPERLVVKCQRCGFTDTFLPCDTPLSAEDAKMALLCKQLTLR